MAFVGTKFRFERALRFQVHLCICIQTHLWQQRHTNSLSIYIDIDVFNIHLMLFVVADATFGSEESFDFAFWYYIHTYIGYAMQLYVRKLKLTKYLLCKCAYYSIVHIYVYRCKYIYIQYIYTWIFRHYNIAIYREIRTLKCNRKVKKDALDVSSFLFFLHPFIFLLLLFLLFLLQEYLY